MVGRIKLAGGAVKGVLARTVDGFWQPFQHRGHLAEVLINGQRSSTGRLYVVKGHRYLRHIRLDNSRPPSIDIQLVVQLREVESLMNGLKREELTTWCHHVHERE